MLNPINRLPRAEEIKTALLNGEDDLDPLFELISTIEALFTLIRHLDINPELKEVFEPLYKQYCLYSNLVVQANTDSHELHG